MILGHNGFTVAYTAPGGLDLWWSATAEHTITCDMPGSADPDRSGRQALPLMFAGAPVLPALA
jgi:hypothetical protein